MIQFCQSIPPLHLDSLTQYLNERTIDFTQIRYNYLKHSLNKILSEQNTIALLPFDSFDPHLDLNFHINRTYSTLIEKPVYIICKFQVGDRTPADYIAISSRQNTGLNIPLETDRSLFVFSLPNRPGALVETLTKFKNANINITKLESRPAKDGQNWEYKFVLECELAADDAKFQQLTQENQNLVWRGSYPSVLLG